MAVFGLDASPKEQLSSPAAAPAEAQRPVAARMRLLCASALVGAVSGVIGAGYLGVLAVATRWLGPIDGASLGANLVHGGVLVATGVAISALMAVLGDPGEAGVLIDSVHTAGGPARLGALVSLVPVSLLTISSGAGIGPEPPLMQTTGTVGAWIGRRLRLSGSHGDLRTLSVTGMASGLTVLFAAPLGAAVFALEILHRRGLEYYEALLPACVGSLSSYGVYTLLTGRDRSSVWHFPASPPSLRPLDLLLGVAAGVGGAIVAHVFSALIRTCARFARRVPSWALPPIAGAALGALGLALPAGLTFGEAQMSQLLRTAALSAPLLALIAVGHLLSAAIPLAGRWKGGIIIPMFLVGYCLGRAALVGTGHGGDPLTLAVALMVACNVGMTKTPLGSTLVVAQSAGVVQLPAMLIAALTSLGLTSRIAFVGNQRHRSPASHP
jgi:H+/Cl- antiporter ClcA